MIRYDDISFNIIKSNIIKSHPIESHFFHTFPQISWFNSQFSATSEAGQELPKLEAQLRRVQCGSESLGPTVNFWKPQRMIGRLIIPLG